MNSPSSIATPATPDVCTVAILIDGQEVPGIFQVQSISVLRELNRIPSATIQIQDGEASKATFNGSNSDHFIPGKKIEIQLGYRSLNQTVFKGIVIKQSIKIRKSGSILIVESRDDACKMTTALKSHYYTDKKDSVIMEEILGKYSLQKQVTSTRPDLKEIVQYDSTDWDFLLCRAEANGMVVLVEDGKVTIGPPDIGGKPVLQVGYGNSLLELDVEMDARTQSTGVQAFSWNAENQKMIVADGKEPKTTENGNLSAATLSKVVGGTARQVRHGGGLGEPELQTWADGRFLKERFSKIRGRAKFQGTAEALPGKVISITGIGERFEGKTYLSGVRHSHVAGNWETDVEFGLNPDLFAETYKVGSLPAAGLIPSIHGLHIGVVTVLEGDPRGEDRIKLRLPIVSDFDEGIWARIATLDAGKERGTFFRPEIGDEVIVGFLNDDPRFPVILGMCNSSAKPSPEPPRDDNHRKGYVSREKMKFIFDDQTKVLSLETPGGNKIILSEKDKGILIQDQNGNKIVLGPGGIKLESNKDILCKAAKDFTVEGNNTELKGKISFTAEGGISAKISGTNATVKGSALTTIEGGMVKIN